MKNNPKTIDLTTFKKRCDADRAARRVARIDELDYFRRFRFRVYAGFRGRRERRREFVRNCCWIESFDDETGVSFGVDF